MAQARVNCDFEGPADGCATMGEAKAQSGREVAPQEAGLRCVIAIPLVLFCFIMLNKFLYSGRRQALLLSTRLDGTV